MPKDNKVNRTATRSLAIERSAIDVENRKVSLCFMTEAVCRNWWIPEVCLCKPENADLTRFENGIAPALFNHDRDKVIGKIESVSFDNGRAKATIVFDSDEEAEKVFEKVKSGSLRGVSVGYIRQKVTRIMATEDEPLEFLGRVYNERTDVTTLWELLEISIVSVPADNDTGVGRELNDENIEVSVLEPEKNLHQKENNKMAKENENIIPPAPNVEAERDLAVQAERKRTQEIIALCRQFKIEEKVCDAMINEGKTVDQARSAILDELAKRNAPAPTANNQNVEFGADEAEKFRAAITDGMAMGCGVTIEKPADGAERFANLSAVRLCAEALKRAGAKNVDYMSNVEIVDLALKNDIGTRAMGSGAMLGIIEDFANKAVKKDPVELPFVYKKFVSYGENNDFKVNHRYEIGLDGLPSEMSRESAEFKYQEMGDAKVTTVLRTFGKAIKFTREIFINDQLGETVKVIRRQKNGFERLKEIMFFETLNKVPFSVKNGNLVTVKGITDEVYSAMMRMMMEQKDVNNEGYVGVAPSYLLAPSEQFMAHQQLLTSASAPNQANAGVNNVVKGIMEPTYTPYLKGDDFFGIASPAMLEGIEFTTLRGNKGVKGRTIIPQSYLGVEYQMYEDFNFNIIDHRAFVKASVK